MTELPSRSPQALAALCHQAGRHAAAWRAQPVRADRAEPRRWLKPALRSAVGGSALAVLAAVAVQFERQPETAAPGAAAPSPAIGHPWAPTHPPSAGGPGSPVAWQGDELVMALDAVPLPQAVAWLAQASGSPVTGLQWLPARPVTLRFRGRDINTAWRLLLNGQAAALSCGSSACNVWIAEPATAPGPATTPVRTPTAAPPAAGPAEGVPGESESQPGGSC